MRSPQGLIYNADASPRHEASPSPSFSALTKMRAKVCVCVCRLSASAASVASQGSCRLSVMWGGSRMDGCPVEACGGLY